MPALEAKGLTKRYKNLTAVDGVDLRVERGTCLALLGPNGAGKTTTVEMLEGLQAPDSGTIEVCGMSLAKERLKIMQRVGVVMQETNLYKRFTVRETLELFASFFEKTQPVPSILERLNLGEKADVQLRKLSGGQKQRVYLGCALINDPELLFLDEPTTGLDPQARRAIWDLMAAAKREGRSILLTTHYMEEAEVLADQVAIIDHGKIIARGTPRQLINEIAGDEVLWVELEGAPGAEAKERLAARCAWFSAARAEDEGFALPTKEPAARVQEIFAAAAAAGLKVKALRIRPNTLEDVFLKLTGRSIRDG